MSGTRIVGDWGSSRLRLWRLRDGAPAERREGAGIALLKRPASEELGELVKPWLGADGPSRMTLCGMAGARNGLREAPYVECPARIGDWIGHSATAELQAIPLRIAAGLAWRSERGVANVMRGEETQLFGAMALDPRRAQGRHLIVLPGTHSKWVWCEDGRILAFRTFITGELYALLCRSSLLVAGGAQADVADESGFILGLDRAREGSGLLGDLFEARTAQLQDGRSGGWAKRFLSGLVLGYELRAMAQDGKLPDELIAIGDPALTGRYERAFASYDAAVERVDGDECVLAGLELLDAHD